MDMTKIFWLVLVVGYGMFTWAAGNFSRAALCFLDGGYLALLSFAVLPTAMGTAYFYPAAAFAGLGILVGFWQEKRRFLPTLVFAIVVGYPALWQLSFSLKETLALAFFGGMGLFHASASIIPDKIDIGKALFSGAGFLSGTFLFCGF